MQTTKISMLQVTKVSKEQYVKEYLERIGLTQPLPQDPVKCLNLLQTTHLATVPFETIDLIRGKEIDLNDDVLYEKIVKNHRGGYCFEVNESLGCLIKALGFDVSTYCARVWIDGFATTPKKNHQVLIVQVDDKKYLVDVGFGNSFASYLPLEITNEHTITDGHNEFRFVADQVWGQRYEVNVNGTWTVLYSFDERVKDYDSDFFLSSFWSQRTDTYPFSGRLLVSLRPAATSRKVLFDKEYTESDGTNKTVVPLNEEKYLNA